MKVKRMIHLHEKVILRNQKEGSPQCDASATRLQALKAEQYELARKL